MGQAGLGDEASEGAADMTPGSSHVPMADGPAGATALSGRPAPCPTCGTTGAIMPPSYVYALGTIDGRSPRLSVEKEFSQAAGRAETANLTDRQVLRKV